MSFEDQQYEGLWQCSLKSKALELIIHDPFLIGIESSSIGFKVVEFPFYNTQGKELGRADALLGEKDPGKRLYLIQYETVDNIENQLKTKETLLITREGLKRQYGFQVTHMLYVHGPSFQVHQLLYDFISFCNNQDYVRKFAEKLR